MQYFDIKTPTTDPLENFKRWENSIYSKLVELNRSRIKITVQTDNQEDWEYTFVYSENNIKTMAVF